MDNVFNAVFGPGTGFGDALARAESRRPSPTSIERMLRDDLAYSKRELQLARERMADAQAEVQRYQIEVRDAATALKAKGLTP